MTNKPIGSPLGAKTGWLRDEPSPTPHTMSESLKASDWVMVPREITLEMQHAYFDVIDRNLRRVETDCSFGRYSSQEQAYRAMLQAAPPIPDVSREADHADLISELTLLKAWLNRLPVPTAGATYQMMRLEAVIETLRAIPLGEGLGEQRSASSESAAASNGRPKAPANCTRVLRSQGLAYPRTCQRCGLGPCPFNAEGK